MNGTRPVARVLAAAALLALSATAQALPEGTVDYALVGTPAALDNTGGAWTVESLGIRVDFGNDTVVLSDDFRLVPGAGGAGLTFTPDDVPLPGTLDPAAGTIAIFATNSDGGTTITGELAGANDEQLLVDFTANNTTGTLMVKPASGPILLEADVVPGETTDDVLAQLNAGPPGAPLREGDAINAATGNLYRSAVDVPPAGPAGLGFTRHYNSRSPLAGDHGWLHDYAGFIDFEPPGFESGLLLVRPDGRGLLFHRTGPNTLATGPDEIPDDVPAVGTDQYPLHWTGSAWRFRNAAGGLEFYDAQGRLLRLVGRDGFARTLERDAAGLIAAVHDDFGRRLAFTHDADGRLERVDGPAGRAWHYAHDDTGRLVGVTDPLGATRTYHYAEAGAPTDSLTGITDERGNRFASWQYDDDNRVTLGERAAGVGRVELDHVSGSGTEVTFANGGLRRYTFATVQGRFLASTIEGDICSDCGKAAAWAYNDLGLPTRITDPRGTVTEFTYNRFGLETGRTEAAGTAVARFTATGWDNELRLPLVVERPLSLTEFDYDARGRLLVHREIDPVGGRSRTTRRAYHPDSGSAPGQLARIDGPRTDVDDVTRFEYDGEGNRTRVVDAIGHVTVFSDHDAFGRARTVTDPNGLVTRLEHDARGRLLSRDVGGELTTHTYDATGNLVATVNPDGSALRREYDAAHRLVAVVDEQGNRINYTLDAAGNRVRADVSGPGGTLARTRQQEFDALGRVIAVIGASGQSTVHEYDANGNRVSSTDPAGHATQREFDFLDRKVVVTDALGGTTRFEYDAADRLVAVTNPRHNRTTVEYDGLGNRLRVDDPDSGVTTFEHDAAGNVIATTDARGQRTERSYDALGRVVRSDHADGSRIEYTWDAGDNGIGRLARTETEGPRGWSSRTEWRHDSHGRVTERRQHARGRTLATRHVYDDAGRRVQIVYPSGRVVHYDHEADAVSAIHVDGATVLEDIAYEPFGPVAGWTRGDGERHERFHDLDGRLVQLGMPGGVRRIGYTPDGNIASIAGPLLNRSYSWDALDRLLRAIDRKQVDTYTYDANGNRISRTAGTTSELYTIAPDSNRLLRITGSRTATFEHDAAGNIIADGVHRYDYGARGLLLAVDRGSTGAYRHDALGQRIHKRARPDVDFRGRAAAARERAGELEAAAAGLREDGRQAAEAAAGARRDAAAARAERERVQARLEQAEAEARSGRRVAGIWQGVADGFAERAERLREHVVEPARHSWHRWRNRLYGRLAAMFERSAEYFGGRAADRSARAEAADERAAQAQLALARVERRLAAAGQRAEAAAGRADRLRAAAREQAQQAAAQQGLAARYRRLAEQGASRAVVQRFVHDEDGPLLGRYAPNGKATREYIRLGDMPVAVATEDAVLDVHPDHLGTPRAVAAPDGPVLWRWISGPFGDGAPDEDADGDGIRFTFNLRFPGQYYDAETGRHHADVRAYDPQLGRHVAPGTGPAERVLNPYAYAGNNPLRSADAVPGGSSPACGAGVAGVAFRGACP